MPRPTTAPPADTGALFDTLEDDLMESAEAIVAIERGEAAPARESVFVGSILVEVREKGEPVWRLGDAAAPAVAAPDPAAVRARLRQTQAGFAALLGVSVRTLQKWEQGTRTPSGSGLSVLRVASSHPASLLASIPAANDFSDSEYQVRRAPAS